MEPRYKWQGRVSPGERKFQQKEGVMHGLGGFRKWRKAHGVGAGWVRVLVAGDLTGLEREAGASRVSVPGCFREVGVEMTAFCVSFCGRDTQLFTQIPWFSFFIFRLSAILFAVPLGVAVWLSYKARMGEEVMSLLPVLACKTRPRVLFLLLFSHLVDWDGNSHKSGESLVLKMVEWPLVWVREWLHGAERPPPALPQPFWPETALECNMWKKSTPCSPNHGKLVIAAQPN